MKHLKEYNRFSIQEGLFTFNEYDKIVKKLFKRVCEIFDIDKLNLVDDDNADFTYRYELEETDSDSGFIKIESKRTYMTSYYLYIDNKPINCSDSISRKLFKFFDKKWNNRRKNKQKEQMKDDLNNFKKKYNL